MPEIPVKQITHAEVSKLAEKAKEWRKQNLTISKYRDLEPIMEEFESCSECFDYLVEEGIITQDKRQSFKNYWSKRNK